MFDKIFNFNLDQFDIEVGEPFSDEDFNGKISSSSSEKLCEIIVCDRFFGCYKDKAISCMQELAQRRVNGDQFEYEKYINKSLSELPKVNTNIANLGDILKQFKGLK